MDFQFIRSQIQYLLYWTIAPLDYKIVNHSFHLLETAI